MTDQLPKWAQDAANEILADVFESRNEFHDIMPSNPVRAMLVEEITYVIAKHEESNHIRVAASRASDGQVARLLRDAVASIKVNDAGDPIERACPWTLEWFHPARELLLLKRGETFTATEGSTEYVRGFEAGQAFALATVPLAPPNDAQKLAEAIVDCAATTGGAA